MVTASQTELKKLPKLQKPFNKVDNGEKAEDVIPRRNRGRVPGKKKELSDYHKRLDEAGQGIV